MLAYHLIQRRGSAVDRRHERPERCPGRSWPTEPENVRKRRAAGRELGFSSLFAIFAGYMLIPLVGVVLFSVATTWFDTVLPVGYTLDHITETINDPLFVPTVGRSLIASLATIVVSVVLMTPVMFLHPRRRASAPADRRIPLAPAVRPADDRPRPLPDPDLLVAADRPVGDADAADPRRTS